jgi:hypothetical protein
MTPRGTIVVLRSDYLATSGAGDLHIASRDPNSGQWTSRVTRTSYRYAYAWLIPTGSDGMSAVATRAVLWKALRYRQPRGTFAYVYNQIQLFQTPSVAVQPLSAGLAVREERPNRRFLDVNASAAQPDVYRDTSGRIHVIYSLQGPTTRGALQLRHAVISAGRVVADAPLPAGLTDAKIVEDGRYRFFLLATRQPSELLVYPGTSSDGTKLGQPWKHSLRYPVHYAGMTIGQTRTGRAASDLQEVVYPSGTASRRPAIAALAPKAQARENLWVHFTLHLP